MVSTESSLSGVLEQLKMKLIRNDFDEMMDARKDLYCFTNGVWNMDTKIFAEHDRNNFVSKHMWV